MVLEGEPLRPEGIFSATEDELTICSSKPVPDDVQNLKPAGGFCSDVSRTERRVFSCKSKERIGTWNVRSMYQGKLEVVKAEMKRMGVGMLGVSELRWTGHGQIQSGEYKIMFSGSATKSNGVALICGPRMSKSIMGFNSVSDRIITARIHGNPVNVTVIQVYAPTLEAEDSVHDDFYERLQETLNITPKGDIVVVMGDLNAKIGEGEADRFVGSHGLGIRNASGDRVHEFCATNDLVVSNTFFKNPPRRLYTWTSPDGKHRNQIDFIMIKGRWKSMVRAAKTRPGADCGSDHELLIADLKLRLKQCGRDGTRPKFNLLSIPNAYKERIQKVFSEINLEAREPEELWQEIKIGIQETARLFVPLQPRMKKNPWLSDTALEIARRRREVKRNNKVGGVGESMRVLNREFQRQARRDKEKSIKDMCTELEESSKKGRSRDLFKMIKKITGEFRARVGHIKADDGRTLSEATQMKQRWKEYTESLYSRDLNISHVYRNEEYTEEPYILQEEVRRAIKELSRNKAPGADDIPIELVKESGEQGVRVLTALCNSIWQSGVWPKDWKRSVYIPIPKKGDSSRCENNRTIALISHTSKILLKIIQARMEGFVNRELPDVQAGFRKSRGTRDQIANVRWLMERSREYNEDVYMCFIDYSKAFDCVDHAVLWSTLRDMGCPGHLVHLLSCLYDGQEATVRTEYGETEWFPIGKGVRQGCIVSPSLFNIYAEGIMRGAGLEEIEDGVRIGGRIINNLRYADDVTLMGRSEESLRKILSRVKTAGEEVGLHLNLQKTKVLSTAAINTFTLDGISIEVVPSFSLLGSVIEDHGECAMEIKKRIVLGKIAMGKLERIWKDRDITRRTKCRLVKALVFPVVTYGCETWVIKETERKRINAFEVWVWRRMLRVPWTAHRTNASIWEEINMDPTLLLKIKSLRLAYFGHVVRGQGLENSVMLGMGGGGRSRGRPRARWIDGVAEDAGMSISQMIEAARDRTKWRDVVHTVARGRHRLGSTR